MSHDGGGQHAREQPPKLSQCVEEGSVVCLHVGALHRKVTFSHHRRGCTRCPPPTLSWPRPPNTTACLHAALLSSECGCACASARQNPSLTSMTVHCSTTMVSLAGGEGLLSSYTNSPSNDRGTGSPGETQRRQHSVTYLHSQRSTGHADSQDAGFTGHVPVSGERKGEEKQEEGAHGPNRKWSIYLVYLRKGNQARGRGKRP